MLYRYNKPYIYEVAFFFASILSFTVLEVDKPLATLVFFILLTFSNYLCALCMLLFGLYNVLLIFQKGLDINVFHQFDTIKFLGIYKSNLMLIIFLNCITYCAIIMFTNLRWHIYSHE